MEQNLPIVAKKFWKIVQVMYLMLRKGISKSKLLTDLNMMMKRAKIACKLATIQNLMFHLSHHATATSTSTSTSTDRHLSYPLDEYEYSCTNSPAAFPTFQLPFKLNKRKKHSHAPLPEDAVLMAAALEMFNSTAPSPALPGFGRTPMVRQLRITDSPFPLRDVGGDNHVDEAAEEFIMKFYRNLRQQSPMPYSLGYS